MSNWRVFRKEVLDAPRGELIQYLVRAGCRNQVLGQVSASAEGVSVAGDFPLMVEDEEVRAFCQIIRKAGFIARSLRVQKAQGRRGNASIPTEEELAGPPGHFPRVPVLDHMGKVAIKGD